MIHTLMLAVDATSLVALVWVLVRWWRLPKPRRPTHTNTDPRWWPQ